MSRDPETFPPIGWRILAPSRCAGLSFPQLSGLRNATVAPFDAARLALLQATSTALLAHPRLRRDPGAAALAFWLRRTHLTQLATEFRARTGSDLHVPAGLVLHITPANVDTMFMLSWALSYLAGNANLVRLTRAPSPLMQDLLACLDAVAATRPDAMRGNFFVTYEHDDALTERLSLACDQRLVWGGDDTVRRLRAIPLNPHAGERSFASKRSLSVISASAYRTATAEARRQLAGQMAADIAPFGQMACSSPHAAYWLSTDSAWEDDARDFTAQLEAAFVARGAEPELADAVRRLSAAFGQAAAGRVTSVDLQPYTGGLIAASAVLAEQSAPCGAGLLVHAACPSLAALAELLRPDHQTVTYFGLTNAEREMLARGAGRAGADRVVPIGRALAFTSTWDGFDLWNDLTRRVAVE